MSLKAKLENLDGVDEALKGLYTDRDGAFHLAVEGMVSKDQLDDFRNRNTKLGKNLQAVEDKLSSVNLDEYQKLKSAQADLDRKKMVDAGEVDKLIEQQVKQMQTEHTAKMDKLTATNGSLTAKLEELTIVGAATSAGNKLGVLSGAVDDLVSRVRQVYKMDGDKAVPKDANDQIIYSATGQGPMPIEEWIQSNLVENASHLFAKSTGGGTKNTNGTGGGHNIISRQQFDDMGHAQRASFFKNEGQVRDTA